MRYVIETKRLADKCWATARTVKARDRSQIGVSRPSEAKALRAALILWCAELDAQIEREGN